MININNFNLKYTKNKQTHFIRLNQLITTFGPGAIHDFVDQSLMSGDLELWGNNLKNIYDKRLQDILNVSCFKTIKTDLEASDINIKFKVPFVQFPEWYFCSKCKKLKKIDEWESIYLKTRNSKTNMNSPICPECSGKKNETLTPVSVLVVCKNGHIDNFPWIEWAHYNKGKVCNRPNLKLEYIDGYGMGKFKLVCSNCDSTNYLARVYDNDFFEDKKKVSFLDDKGNKYYPFKCKGRHPHKGITSDCDELLKSIGKNSLSLYNPKLISSILIPPYTDIIFEQVSNHENFNNIKNDFEKIMKKDIEKLLNDSHTQFYIDDMAKELDKEYSKIEYAIKMLLNTTQNIEKNISKEEYRYEEYMVLLSGNEYNDYNFSTQRQDINDYGMDALDEVILVKSLREIIVQTGFSRINYPDNSSICNEDNKNIVSIRNKKNWLPAYESKGEGIFIKFNDSKIDEWSNNKIIQERAKVLNKRYQEIASENNYFGRNITPKFILLHSIAHMLIRELSFNSGYPITALKERIYCNSESDNIMSGILIYTADSDSEGSLGGLVRQGKSDILPNIIKKSIQKMTWCSSDPICSFSEAQGRNNLNLAACHSCLLLPETSCEEFNTLLDRVMVVGGLDDNTKDIGFYSKYV